MKTANFLALIVMASIYATALCEYSSPIAAEMAHLSAVAYENPLAIDAWSCKLCSKYKINQPNAFVNLSSGVVGFTGYSTSLSAIVVVFRGANDVNTFIQDLKTPMVSYSKCEGCQVSQNFYQFYMTVQQAVFKNVENLHRIYRSSKIYIAGHGLGGSFATLAAIDVSELYQSTDAVYTFGACRVGNKAFSNYYTKTIPETFRVIHYADVVPHLPIATANYVHAGW